MRGTGTYDNVNFFPATKRIFEFVSDLLSGMMEPLAERVITTFSPKSDNKKEKKESAYQTHRSNPSCQ